MDAGVDVHDVRPFGLDEVEARMRAVREPFAES